jgi:hypothetical protein
MPATIAKGGFGTKLQSDATGSFQPVAEIGTVSGPQISVVLVDATHMESPNGAAEKIAVGVHEIGDISFEASLIENDSTQLQLFTDARAKTKRNWRIILPGGAKRWAGPGYVSSIGDEFQMRDRMVRRVVITPSGDWVFENNT